MARPLVFWQQTADNGQLSTIWFGGNPVLWWCGLAAICITAARLVSRPNLAGAFVVIGYLGYLLIVVPISRVMYLYHYMPALFLGFLALANVASDCWRGRGAPLGAGLAAGCDHSGRRIRDRRSIRGRRDGRDGDRRRRDPVAIHRTAAGWFASRFSPPRWPRSSTFCRFGSDSRSPGPVSRRECGCTDPGCTIGPMPPDSERRRPVLAVSNRERVSRMEVAAREVNAQPIADRTDAIAAPGKWSQTDSVLLFVLLAATAATRFWRLGYPGAPVFDEGNFVGQAATYLRGEQYIDPHPPLARELMALGMWLFGPTHAWAWRLSNAVVGTALVGITYALGRRMFASRLAGALAASFILLDGLFLVDSRTGVLEIVYLTLAALSYLLLFKFLQALNRGHGKRTLLLLGISLGLCLGAKLLLPGVTFLVVMAFLTYGVAVTAAAPARLPLAGSSWVHGCSSARPPRSATSPHFCPTTCSSDGAACRHW